MKVHELITKLQNFPMDADVYCLHEDSDYVFNGGYSQEVTIVEECLVEEVIARVSGYNDLVIIK